MADFKSGFWNWYIFILMIVSFVYLLALVLWMGKDKRKPGEKAQPMGHVWDGDLQELNNPLPKWWLYLYYGTMVFGVGDLALYPGLGIAKGALGWSEVGQYEAEMKAAGEKYGPLYDKYRTVAIKELAANPEANKMGERLYMTYCTVCHGADAKGNLGFPNLTDKDWLYGGAPEQIQASIMNGRTGIMPPWGAMLGQEGVFNVSEYVMSLSGREVNDNAAAAGKEKFQQVCAACHGADGKGNIALGAPNLTDNIWLYGGSQKRIIETIAFGRSGKMPAHGEFLGEAKAHLLAAYLYGLSNNQTAAGK